MKESPRCHMRIRQLYIWREEAWRALELTFGECWMDVGTDGRSCCGYLGFFVFSVCISKSSNKKGRKSWKWEDKYPRRKKFEKEDHIPPCAPNRKWSRAILERTRRRRVTQEDEGSISQWFFFAQQRWRMDWNNTSSGSLLFDYFATAKKKRIK